MHTCAHTYLHTCTRTRPHDHDYPKGKSDFVRIDIDLSKISLLRHVEGKDEEAACRRYGLSDHALLLVGKEKMPAGGLSFASRQTWVLDPGSQEAYAEWEAKLHPFISAPHRLESMQNAFKPTLARQVELVTSPLWGTVTIAGATIVGATVVWVRGSSWAWGTLPSVHSRDA